MKLVLIRHGESQWNLENKFTGWTDVDLSKEGIVEAAQAGNFLLDNNFKFDVCYTSYLKRAIKTLNIVLEELNQLYLPVYKTWRLNERHYGALQGLNKQETADKYGDKQILIWRRSYDVHPPFLNEEDNRNPKFDPKYKDIDPNILPLAESLQDTVQRVLPYWNENISQHIKNGENVLIVAHGNSLRALVKYLLNISNDDILHLNLPTGKPIIFDLDENLNVLETTLELK